MAEQIPQVSGIRVARACERAEWVLDRQRASHAHLTRRGGAEQMIVPMHRRPLPPGTLRNILEAAGLSIDQLRALL